MQPQTSDQTPRSAIPTRQFPRWGGFNPTYQIPEEVITAEGVDRILGPVEDVYTRLLKQVYAELEAVPAETRDRIKALVDLIGDISSGGMANLRIDVAVAILTHLKTPYGHFEDALQAAFIAADIKGPEDANEVILFNLRSYVEDLVKALPGFSAKDMLLTSS